MTAKQIAVKRYVMKLSDDERELLDELDTTLRANNSETSTPREFNLEGAQGSSRSCPCSTHQSMPRQAPP